MIEFLDSRQLVSFTTLIQTKNFTETAKKLGLTQSAISHSIRNLEIELNCQLVQRMGRKILITEEGELLYTYAQRILSDMKEAKMHIIERTNLGKTKLRIGASTTVCEHFLPTILREFNECFPKCSLSISPVDTPEQKELLKRGEIDLGIIIDGGDLNPFEVQRLFQDELLLITSPIHPWATQSKINFDQWDEQRLVLYNHSSQTYQSISTYLSEKKLDLSNGIELASMEAIKELVKTNFGISILADWIVEEEINHRSLTSFRLGRKRLKRQWSIAYLKGKKLSITEETFLGLATSLAETRFK